MTPALLPESSPSVRGAQKGEGRARRRMEKWTKGRGKMEMCVRGGRKRWLDGKKRTRCLERWWRDGERDGGSDGWRNEGRGGEMNEEMVKGGKEGVMYVQRMDENRAVWWVNGYRSKGRNRVRIEKRRGKGRRNR